MNKSGNENITKAKFKIFSILSQLLHQEVKLISIVENIYLYILGQITGNTGIQPTTVLKPVFFPSVLYYFDVLKKVFFSF